MADPASLLPDLPPVPRAKATLIGGTVERLDRVRERVTVRVFGGGRMSVLYDPRTRVYLGTRTRRSPICTKANASILTPFWMEIPCSPEAFV